MKELKDGSRARKKERKIAWRGRKEAREGRKDGGKKEGSQGGK